MKVVIVLLIVLVVAFFAAVTMGFRQDKSADAEEPPLPEKLQSLFPEKPPVKVADIASDCFKTGTFSFIGSCSVRIGPSDSLLRLADLKLGAGSNDVELTYVPRQGHTIRDVKLTFEEQDSGQDASRFDLPVQSEGGTLLLKCSGLKTCTVQLKAS